MRKVYIILATQAKAIICLVDGLVFWATYFKYHTNQDLNL